jgi:hypothetical protein
MLANSVRENTASGFNVLIDGTRFLAGGTHSIGLRVAGYRQKRRAVLTGLAGFTISVVLPTTCHIGKEPSFTNRAGGAYGVGMSSARLEHVFFVSTIIRTGFAACIFPRRAFHFNEFNVAASAAGGTLRLPLI